MPAEDGVQNYRHGISASNTGMTECQSMDTIKAAPRQSRLALPYFF